MELARRLERAEARSNANFVEARARAFPDRGAVWIEVAGAYAMFDGVGSPVTQTFGLRYAATQGCTVGMMVALPGSGSQRNAERHGFRIAYTRTKWGLDHAGL